MPEFLMTESTKKPDIRIGACVEATRAPFEEIEQLVSIGVESLAITFWGSIGEIDLKCFRDRVFKLIEGKGIEISALTLFGNPLEEGEEGNAALADWRQLIDAAEDFSCPLITGFTGGLPGKPVPENMPRLKEVFSPLLESAGERGLKLAFENCVMGSTWKSAGRNLAFCPEAFELIFETLPYANLGLEWEPAHLIKQMINPIENLINWAPKIFHYHGKDGQLRREVLRQTGTLGSNPWFWQRFPGYGDTDWSRIISEARNVGFSGAINIEGHHDPIFCNELEMAGMAGALGYLRQCRGGKTSS